mmetsp:Transcript_47753/g.116246  ORF Transcript_47753/g.116246 Transcript_47753/m.116246 type:complete len:83 (+) Transcript_47753:177-425(+)
MLPQRSVYNADLVRPDMTSGNERNTNTQKSEDRMFEEVKMSRAFDTSNQQKKIWIKKLDDSYSSSANMFLAESMAEVISLTE